MEGKRPLQGILSSEVLTEVNDRLAEIQSRDTSRPCARTASPSLPRCTTNRQPERRTEAAVAIAELLSSRRSGERIVEALVRWSRAA